MKRNSQADLKRKNPVSKAKEFVFKYPGFVVALLLVVLLSLVFFSASTLKVSPEEASYLKQGHEESQAYFDELLLALEENKDFTETLDDDYYYSIKEDYEWVKAKENEIYAQGFLGLREKEVALMVFVSELTALNQSFVYDFTEPDYEAEINAAITTQIKYPDLFSEADLSESFETDAQKKIFTKTLDELFTEYIGKKRLIIEGDSPLERRYVEAKKLLMLNEAALDVALE
jgi:hypothetical protein